MNSAADNVPAGWPPFTLLENTDVCLIAWFFVFLIFFFPYEKGKSLPFQCQGFWSHFCIFLYVSPKHVPTLLLTLELPHVGSYPDQLHLSVDVVKAFGNALRHSLMVLISTSLLKENVF